MRYSDDYGEEKMVRDGAGDVLSDLGWEVVMAGPWDHGNHLGRLTPEEVLLEGRLLSALRRLNPWLTPDGERQVLRALHHHLASASLMEVNEKNYNLCRDGVEVEVKENGRLVKKTALLFDFNEPKANDFLAVKEFPIREGAYSKRADLLCFVNGIPLGFMEFKKDNVDIKNAYNDNYQDYLETVPSLFHYNAFVILSNGREARVGALGSAFEYFHEWKRLREEDAGSVALGVLLRGVCAPANFMDLFENFILYDHMERGTAKILAENHQFLGVNKAIQAYEERKIRKGKIGVFWHTQGSGKSYSMVFFTRKILRKLPGHPTFLLLTDRDELNGQLAGTFFQGGMLAGGKASQFMAKSGQDLLGKLRGNGAFIFSLIQKFNQKDTAPIHTDHDVVIISDEAHRSQYGDLARNMMRLLPNASRIGFTGTPLFIDGELTKETFGDYISIYDFRRAIEDGATVPLYYENRSGTLELQQNPHMDEEILQAIADAELDADETVKVEGRIGKAVHVLTSEPRLRAVAKDFVNHYTNIWQAGKAMVVSIDKVTAVRMYQYVQEYWEAKIADLEKKESMGLLDAEDREKLAWMKETEMHVVISQEQNEQKLFSKWGIDILPFREILAKGGLDKRFKDGKDPFRIVFVCAMWLTGFDVKELAALYLDKPMKAHTLMQAIARVNRVAPGKSQGLIVDYVGVVEALQKALAQYTSDDGKHGGGSAPVFDKKELICHIQKMAEEAERFLLSRGVSLEQLVHASKLDRIPLLQDAANGVCENPETRKAYVSLSGSLKRMVRGVQPADLSDEVWQKLAGIFAIADRLHVRVSEADTTDLMVKVNQIVSGNVSVVRENGADTVGINISDIDFQKLSAKFSKSRHRNFMFYQMVELVQKQLDRMLAVNPGRAKFYEKYQKIIERYNALHDKEMLIRLFNELSRLARDMGEEERRYVREGFDSEEELAIFDLLEKKELTPEEVKTVKKVSVDLLRKVKERIQQVPRWQDNQTVDSQVQQCIRNMVWELPEACYDDRECGVREDAVYQYIRDQYR